MVGCFMPCVCVMHCRRRFFFGKNDVPGIFMPCVCVMHCRRRFFFRKSDVPGIFMPCVCVMHCRRRSFWGKMRGIEGQGCCVGGSPKAIRKGAYPPTIKARWRVSPLCWGCSNASKSVYSQSQSHLKMPVLSALGCPLLQR